MHSVHDIMAFGPVSFEALDITGRGYGMVGKAFEDQPYYGGRNRRLSELLLQCLLTSKESCCSCGFLKVSIMLAY